MEKQTHVHLKDSITTQILKVVFPIYLLVTVTVTLLHMEAEYHKTKGRVVDDLLFFQKSYATLLKDSLQKEEKESLEKLLFTVLEHPNILGIYLEHVETKEILAVAGYFQNKEGETLFLGTQGGPIKKITEEFIGLFDHNYLLEYTSQEGRLVPVAAFLYSSDAIILKEVIPSFYFIIANSVIKTFAFWFIYLWVSRILLTHPLSTLTSAARSISLGNLEHFRIIVNTYGRNELKIMEEAFTSMVQNLLTARKKLEESMENLRTIASEGQVISSQRSYSVLAKQVNDSFAKIAHRSVITELLYSGYVLKTEHSSSFYYVGNEDQAFVEVLPQKIANNDQLCFDIEDAKEKVCLGQIRFSIPKYDKEHLEAMIPIYRPLFVNIANTIKNISMVKKIQIYASDLENKNSALEEMNQLKETFLANTSHDTSIMQSSHSIQTIEGALEDVRPFEAKLEDATGVITEDEEGLKVRNAIVQVMSLTIQYWEKSTQKSKVDLAEESRLWKVYLDKGTFRTRTMDRYLFLTSLPKKPRWRSVISTANFVLHTAPNLEPYRSSLKSAITSLQDLLYQNS